MTPLCRLSLPRRLRDRLHLSASLFAVLLLAIVVLPAPATASVAAAPTTQQACVRDHSCGGDNPTEKPANSDSAVDGEPAGCRQDDPACGTLQEGNREFRSDDDVFWAFLVDGKPVVVVYEPAADVELPPVLGFQRFVASRRPDAQFVPLRQVVAADVQIQPLGTPNYVNITMHYSDDQIGGLQESSLRMFYFDDDLGAWIELPSLVDPLQDTVTVMNVDVSAFANRLHRIAVYG